MSFPVKVRDGMRGVQLGRGRLTAAPQWREECCGRKVGAILTHRGLYTEGMQKRFDWTIKSIFSTGKSLPVEGCAVQLCLAPRWHGGDVSAGNLRSSPFVLPGCVIVFKSLV